MQIYVLGLNHRTAPLSLREQIAFGPDEAREAVDRLASSGAAAEVVLLSTCNRTEIYTVSERPQEALAKQIELVHETKGVDLHEHEAVYLHRQRDCVEHLFRVAGGVDSMVIGEPEILGQVKEAYDLAIEHESAGALFGKLFPSAFRVGKRARSETGIGRGAVSLAKAGIQLAEKIFGELNRRSALVVGAGTIAETIAIPLHRRSMRSLVFANRTLANAEKLAARYDGRATTLDDLTKEVANADVVMTAVHSSRPMLTEENLRRALEGRKRGPLLVVDLGVPRNVDAKAARLNRLFLYAVDDLQELVNLNLGRRRQEIPAVEEIVREEADRFFGWMVSLSTKPVVTALRGEAERVRLEAIERLGSLSDEQRQLVEKFSRGFMNKILHAPTVSVRQCDPATHLGLTQLEWTRHLFGLDAPGVENGEAPRADE